MFSARAQHYQRCSGEVDNVTLTMPSAQITALLGPSGCGKTTLLRLIAGLDRPDDGRILFDGKDVTGIPAERRPTAMVFQGYALWPHKTVAGNIAFGLKVRGLPRRVIEEKIAWALELVGMTGLDARLPGQLSGGQRQRVALARVLALEPAVLLLDEPLSSLDADLRLRVREDIRALQRRLGLTVVLVTHDQEEALAIADHVAVLHAGRLEQAGAPTELYLRPKTAFVARLIGRRNFLSGHVLTVEKDTAAIAAAGAVLRVGREPWLQPGAHVRLALRGECLRLCNGGEGFEAIFRSAAFQGAFHRLTLVVGDDSIQLDVATPPEELRPGAPCRIAVTYDGIAVFPA
jgi:ABC-type Fe3+/spermidine/putrescine transport system ATPase subunit